MFWKKKKIYTCVKTCSIFLFSHYLHVPKALVLTYVTCWTSLIIAIYIHIISYAELSFVPCVLTYAVMHAVNVVPLRMNMAAICLKICSQI